ncbi:AraC family transcriptional regulator [Gracilibacillus alcaliphilus]|uniref:AraC family transcriptional regulator n=1 Tax=Gracilibacillus alcaliphilus TaxID=1401441 RepID=UPI00195DDAC0|nr:AraC family transcriptional regulator [Gracilibacillus alcaliphilus]MBM7677735.1 AraC-like DNA-binding protein [Gracilibacillus alcaliphilus]
MERNIRKKDGFISEKLLVLPDYVQEKLVHHELLQDLFVTDIGFFPNAKYHFRERPAGAKSHIFIYCSNGEGWIELNRKPKRVIKKNTLVVIPADTPHSYGTEDNNPWSIYWFHLSGEHVPSFIKTFDLNGEPLQFPNHFFTKFTELFDQCYNMLNDKPYSQIYHIQVSQTMRFLLSTIGITSLQSKREEKREHYLDNAVQYMTDRLHTTIKLSDLAKSLGLSKQHVIYIFKQETGFPPIDYFIRLKMKRACQMLDLTDMSIKEICNSLGVTDPYYFSRLFKKVMGSSPTEYRKKQKG